MKLYYSPGACSLSPHIVLAESGLPFELDKVDFSSMRSERGADFSKVNPKGYVPVIQLDDGEMLTEGSAIVQYIADHAPKKKLAPPAGTMARYRLQEWLNFIATELHKGFSPLFNQNLSENMRARTIERLNSRLEFAAKRLEGSNYLMGDDFTVADAYLFTILRWASGVNIDLSRLPVLVKYQERIAERPAVQRALEEEGLLEMAMH
jgi:glutathione S-transferase